MVITCEAEFQPEPKDEKDKLDGTSSEGISSIERFSVELIPQRRVMANGLYIPMLRTKKMPRLANDAVHWYIGELTSRIVAESGIPSDRYHLGKILLQSFKDAPDFLLQIDGARDDKETNKSVLARTVRCANAMKAAGLKIGDVVVMMAPNHLDLSIPFYAGFCIGAVGAPMDRTMDDLRIAFDTSRPKVVFCQSDKAAVIQLVVNELKLDTLVVTFDKCESFCSFNEFLERGTNGLSDDQFKPADFDPEHTVALLISTSGTNEFTKICCGDAQKFSYNYTLFVPTFFMVTPAIITLLLYRDDGEHCDMTCLDLILLGGSSVPKGFIENVQKVLPETEVIDSFGMTELTMSAFHGDDPSVGSCGKRMGCHQYRLVDIETKEDILEPHVPGELWVKGPGVFKEAFAEGGWFKTGDIFYRDEKLNYYHVERMKSILKYKGNQISPAEIEGAIHQHPGVLYVAVTGVPDNEDNELPTACVVRRPGHNVTAQEIKDFVKELLADIKHLRGGVIFLDDYQ
ncbi:unnamed protein product [Diatraea saccharalis]|uniref:Uncharacterized protein n=1 Tax=Diatraea saccharalis TaxID=40085 RepID=A0A9N9R893_9NEOP|nr:unnamed protein product [Diatraea saccharalis]